MASPPTKAGLLASRLRQILAITRQMTHDLRQWALASRIHAAIVAAAAVLLLTVTVILWTVLAARVTEPRVRVTLRDVLAALDEKRFDDARKLVEALGDEVALPPEEYSGPPFALGAIAAYEAESLPDGQRRQSAYLAAARLLQEAARRRFPSRREAEGWLLLGRSLIEAEQHVEAVPFLEKALQLNPQQSTHLHRLLVTAHLRSPDPDLEAARRHSAAELADRTLAPHERAEALLRRSDILLRLREIDEVSSLIEQLPQELRGRPPVQMIQARLLMAQGARLAEQATGTAEPTEAAARYRSAITMLRDLQTSARQDSDLARGAMFLIGQCYAELPGETDAALEQLARIRKLYPRTPEGIAASLAEAELLRRLSRDDEAADAYARTLQAVGDSRDYHNQWLPLRSLRLQVVSALENQISKGRFETALSLLDEFSPTFDPLPTLTHKAQLYRKWGEFLIEAAALESLTQAAVLTRRGRTFYRRAAGVYEDISRLRIADREYPDELWRAAESYMDGHSFSNAVRALQLYLASEAVARRPQALVKLGEAHLAQSDLDRALAALEECIELHERDASIYEARVLCARANAEKGDLARAEQLLRANLTARGLTPASREWRESLFELGKLKYAEGEYLEAIKSLREYVERYDGEEPSALLARYFVAQSYRHAAREPLAKLAAAITENERLKHRTQADELLSEAIADFSQVQRTLTLKSADAPLSPLEQAILRNCYLLRGDVLFSMRDYEQALEVFRNASSLYQHDPIVLDAYLQIASCHRRLGQLQEARGAIEQAKIVLSRLPKDADFTVATAFGKEQWARLLNDMSNW